MDLRRFLNAAAERVVSHHESLPRTRIAPTVSAGEVQAHLDQRYGDFEQAAPLEELLGDVSTMMLEWNLHVTHPRYFGLFNPDVFPAGVAADLLVAGFNPQLAAWSHAPAANEIERYTLRFLASCLGLDPDRTFGTQTAYMPVDIEDTLDPYSSTLQWSRRHIGLKLFMTLAALGADGYREAIERQTEMGDRLRRELPRQGWKIVNSTPLPVVCFTRDEIESGSVTASQVATRLQEENFWISPVSLGGQTPALRACVTSYKTAPDDISALVEAVTEVAEVCGDV